MSTYGQGGWNHPECYPENRDPINVDPNERCPFVPNGDPNANKCGDITNSETSYLGYQSPRQGETVETKPPTQTNQIKNPEPAPCACNCSPGPITPTNKIKQSIGTTTINVELKLTNISIFCECKGTIPAGGNVSGGTGGSNSPSIGWWQECEDTTLKIPAQAETFSETWDETYDVSCSCDEENDDCSCSGGYNVTTSYAREFYVIPDVAVPDSIPGCECDPNLSDSEKTYCPEPCKPVQHNWGEKCNGCGGSHGPDPNPQPKKPNSSPSPSPSPNI